MEFTRPPVELDRICVRIQQRNTNCQKSRDSARRQKRTHITRTTALQRRQLPFCWHGRPEALHPDARLSLRLPEPDRSPVCIKATRECSKADAAGRSMPVHGLECPMTCAGTYWKTSIYARARGQRLRGNRHVGTRLRPRADSILCSAPARCLALLLVCPWSSSDRIRRIGWHTDFSAPAMRVGCTEPWERAPVPCPLTLSPRPDQLQLRQWGGPASPIR